MAKKQDALMENLLLRLNARPSNWRIDWHWDPDSLWNADLHLRVYRDGTISWSRLGTVKLPWNQKRSVARAFARLHRELTCELARVGQRELKTGTVQR